MKFKVGDEVKVMGGVGIFGLMVGKVGVVTNVNSSRFPYTVKCSGYREIECRELELELVADAPTTPGILTLTPSNTPFLQCLDSAPLTSVRGFSWNSCEIGYLALTEALQGDHPYVRPRVDDEAMSVWIDLMRFCKEG